MIQSCLAIALLALAQVPGAADAALGPALERARAAFVDDGADPDARRARVVAAVDGLAACEAAVRSVDAMEALRELGRVAYRLGDLDTALRATEIALADLDRRVPVDPLTRHDVRSNIASFKRDLGDVEGALAIQLELLAGLETRGTTDEDDRALSLRTNLGSAYLALRRTAEARDQFERVLATRIRLAAGVEDAETQYARINLAITLRDVGESERAFELQSTAVAHLERLLDPNDPVLADVRLLVANTAYETGNLGRARALYEIVLESFERRLPEGHPQVQRARLNFALLVQDLGDLARARALQEGVVRVWTAALPPEHPELLLARGHLAASMAEAGDLLGARATYEELQATLELTQPAESDDIQTNRQGLAAVLRQLGEIEPALELERKVLEVWSSRLPDDSPALLEAKRNHAITLDLSDDPQGARAIRREVLDAYESATIPDRIALARARRSYALSVWRDGDLAGARELLLATEADESSLLPPDSATLGTTFTSLAWLEAQAGRPAESERWARRALARVRRVVTGIVGVPAREMAAILEREEFTTRMTLALCEASVPSAEYRRELFEAIESMRVRAALPAIRPGAEDDASFARLRECRRSLNDRVASLGESADPESARKEIAELVRTRDLAEREVAAKYGLGAPAIRVETLAAALAPDARAVSFRTYMYYPSGALVDGERRMVAFVLAPDGKLTRVAIGTEAAVAAAIERWRAAIGSALERGLAAPNPNDDAEAAGIALRALVLDPLTDALGDARTIHVALDGPLHLVALDALPERATETGQAEPIGTARRFVVESSFARLVSPTPKHSGPTSFLGIGGVAFNAAAESEPGESSTADNATAIRADAEAQTTIDAPDVAESAAARAGPLGSNWAPLPQTRAEAERIGALFTEVFESEPVVLLGRSATKSAFAERARGQRFLHIATHGYFAGQDAGALIARSGSLRAGSTLDTQDLVTGLAPWTLCGLAFAGANRGADRNGRVPGILTAEELMSIDLSQCDLAVLSACETNVGIARAGSGIRSLQAALHAAGARTAITSLWRVDDEATRELFEDFYVRIWVGGEAKATALWNAKMALRRKGRPLRDWAGWVLSGDPG